MSTSIISVHSSDAESFRFADWLSGFVDGEGYFMLQKLKKCGVARFGMTLRSDDHKIMETIRDFFGCGKIRKHSGDGKFVNSKPQLSYTIEHLHHLVRYVIPLFDKHPLRAKKARDFAIWREAVLFLHSVRTRKARYGNGARRGMYPKWTVQDMQEFVQYHDALRDVSKYTEPDSESASKVWKRHHKKMKRINGFGFGD